MKTGICFALTIMVFNELNAQFGHIPPCGGTSHSQSICFGYATARAFGKTWNDPYCPASTLYQSSVDTVRYFEIHHPFSLQTLRKDDIVEFGKFIHVAYVSYVPEVPKGDDAYCSQ